MDAFYNPVGAHKGTVGSTPPFIMISFCSRAQRQMQRLATFSTKTSVSLTPNFSISRARKRRPWILSSVSCSKSFTRHWKTVSLNHIECLLYADAETFLAGITLEDVRGSSSSVFCGSFTNDYRDMINKDLGYYPKYTATGIGNSILANRISYFYDLHGASVTMDTACSSSLVCFHMGNRSVQDDNADLSLVVGSSLHFDPNMFVMMTDLGFLSSDGRCRAFDASGKGYVRGEGICAVILKRKSRAQLHGNKVRAVVRGTGINHDGAKDGITMPNSFAQEHLIRDTYKHAGLDTNDTQYFEAHGTGTQAGDPRESRAIGSVFAPNRDSPLYVGSVKTNIGHLEGASGLAGIIKSTLALERGKIPPNMLFNNPNPNIDFEKLNITVPTKELDWKSAHGVKRASINSFGYGKLTLALLLHNLTSGV